MIGMRSFGVVPGMVLALLIVLGAAGAAWLAYNACVDNDLAQSAAGEEPVRPPGYGYGFHPFGPGFGLLGCLVFPLLFFLFFGAMRMVVWPWRWPGRRIQGLNHGPIVAPGQASRLNWYDHANCPDRGR